MELNLFNEEKNASIAKPFVKWAGGKSQLIEQIAQAMNIQQKDEFLYVEPFVGGGAVLFWVLNQYPNISKAVINDINKDLILTYTVIQSDIDALIPKLKEWEIDYYKFREKPVERKVYYYQKRKTFNSKQSDVITRAALLIFLNRTCFNGLYRVNRKNEFNVPIGSYTTPTICNEKNLIAIHKALQKVEILTGDFVQTIRYATEHSFYYIDPPYKPLSKTSNFNDYAKQGFNDSEQIRLKTFCDKLTEANSNWLLSNSDVKDSCENNTFFDDLYKDYHIKRVKARRVINSNGKKRGKIDELLITNY